MIFLIDKIKIIAIKMLCRLKNASKYALINGKMPYICIV